MELRKALRLGQTPKMAFVGSGGKTTALFTLARELPQPVIVTTSAHLSVDQTKLADTHHISRTIDEAKIHLGSPQSGVVLITGEIDRGRVMGLSKDTLIWLNQYCSQKEIPLLIEADGSRLRPLKAPANHEPPIPDFVDIVLVVAGLSGLGKRLSSEIVYQPDLFSQISGTSIGDLITPESIIRTLNNKNGGLKNIPPGAKKVALLNQSDSLELSMVASDMAQDLLSKFNTVLVSSTKPMINNDLSNTIEDPISVEQKIDVSSVHEHVAGVVLAAGSASRMGSPKQLLPWRGKPLVWHAAKKALQAGLSPVVVVTGAYHEGIESALVDLPVTVSQNENWQNGQGSSVSVGVNALPENIGAVLFLLADQPLLSVELVTNLIKEHSKTLSPIVAPWINGKTANPVLFDKSLMTELSKLSGQEGGRRLFSRYSISTVSWDDPSVFFDVDSMEDYNLLLEIVDNSNKIDNKN